MTNRAGRSVFVRYICKVGAMDVCKRCVFYLRLRLTPRNPRMEISAIGLRQGNLIYRNFATPAGDLSRNVNYRLRQSISSFASTSILVEI